MCKKLLWNDGCTQRIICLYFVRKVTFICCLLSCCSLHFMLLVLFSVAVSLINPLNAELNPTCHLLALLGRATIVVISRLSVNAAISDFELCFIALPYFTFVHVTVINIYGKRSVMLATIGLTENMTSTAWSCYLQGTEYMSVAYLQEMGFYPFLFHLCRQIICLSNSHLGS